MIKKLSVACYVKNEALYLPEWIEFHRLQGVEHFYFYNNDSSDDTERILELYSTDGDITIIPWSLHHGQIPAYWDSVQRARGRSRWHAIFDADEFLFSPTGKSLPEVLDGYNEISAVAVHWYLYGSSGLIDYDPRLVIERFTHRCAKINHHCKTILRPMFCAGPGSNTHTMRMKGRVVDEKKVGMPVEYAIIEGATGEVLRINHYHTKSREEARKRWLLPRGDNSQIRGFEENFPHHDVNEVQDLYVLKFVDEIKSKIKAKGI